ncbi:MAG: YihY/virulence factor BrkB family protein [Burkholderiaceae bacterium]
MPDPYEPGTSGAWGIARCAIQRFFRHNMPVYAAALVFHVLLSVFPFILLLMALASFLGLGDLVAWNRLAAPSLVPPRLVALLVRAIRELPPLHGGILSFSAAAALWLASRATRATIQAMNVVYEVATPRPAWRRYLVSLAYTVGLVILLTAAGMLMAAGPTVLHWLAWLSGLDGGFVRLWTWLRWPAALISLASAIAIVYYAAPNVVHEFRFVTMGSVLCVAAWGLASFLLRLYVIHIASYYKTYGSVGAIVLLLFYLYLSMISLLFGTEVNAVLEARRHTGQD